MPQLLAAQHSPAHPKQLSPLMPQDTVAAQGVFLVTKAALTPISASGTQLNLWLTPWMCSVKAGSWPNRPLDPRASFPIWFSCGWEGERAGTAQNRPNQIMLIHPQLLIHLLPSFAVKGWGNLLSFSLYLLRFWSPTTPHYRDIT